MKTAHIFISGFVQGVGFRYFIRKNALELGLRGWTRNTLDGRVEAILQGPKEKIERIIQLSQKGPFLAEVKTLDAQWKDTKERFEAFEIVV